MLDQFRCEAVFVRDGLEPAIAMELPAVKRAGELRDAAAIVLRDAVAAVRTGVVEGLDRAIRLADQDDLLGADLEHGVIAVLGNVRDDAGEQPYPGPHALPFALHELAREIARGIRNIEPVVEVGLLRLK